MKLKKTLSSFLALVLLLSCMSITAFADTEPWANNATPNSNQIFYTATAEVTMDGATSTYDSNSGKGILTFSESITEIGNEFFYDNSDLTGIILPATITSIGDSAFANCTNLKSVDMPGVTSIGASAFANCTSLESVEMPATITSIGDSAFQYCTSLKSVEMPATITSIGASTFANCTSLESVKMPEVTSIGDSAFQYCKNLKSVEMPKATSIGNSTFANCGSLESVKMPKVTSIGDSAFQYCTNLKNVEMPKATSIGASAFANCTSLERVKMPEVTSIGDRAFQSCTNLKSVDMPKATSIGSFAFKSCNNLKYVYAPDTDGVQSSLKNYSIYKITASAANGTIAVDGAGFDEVDGCVTYLKSGKEYTMTATPDVGYKLDSLTATYNDGEEKSLTITNGSFTMPAYAVTVTATFFEKKTTGTINLDLEDSTDYSDSTTIDQYYTKVAASSTVYKNKIKVEWSNDTMNIKVADAKKWNPVTLAWETDEAKNGVATVDGETNKTTVTLTNYSAKAFTCNLSFEAEESQKAKFTSYAVNATDVNLAAVANDINQPGVTLDTSVPTTATITATITPKLEGEGSFAGAEATTSAVKYGTFTITCTAVAEN